MGFSIEDLEAPKKLNETDAEVPHFVFSFSDDSLQDDTIERKMKALYNYFVRYIKPWNTQDP